MSCLFNSLSHFIKEDSHTIRQKICNYLKEDKPIIDGLETKDVLKFENNNPDNYIEHMRLTSTWGGAIEIQCACNLWDLQINVLNYRDAGEKVIEFIPLNKNSSKTINIYWTGTHYEPVKCL